jgi:hypothetical protein
MIAFYKNKSFYKFFIILYDPITNLSVDIITSATTYLLGLILIFYSFFLILDIPTSNRTYLVAGILLFFGVILNLIGYLTKNSIRS